MTTQAEIDKAISQPWTVYNVPEDVLADDRLTEAQKRRVLEGWERDARELAVAEDENMGGGEPNMLGRVLQALGKLPAEGERLRGPATKHGAQPTLSSSPQQATKTAAPTISGKAARQGEIILDTPSRRAVFIGALVVAALVGLVLLALAWPPT
jgi:hypothetical protein